MFKKIKDKLVDFNNDTYGMLITASWVVLIICLVIKLFGGNWFELEIDNGKFIEFCTLVDNTMWLKMVLACLICLVSTYFIICILIKENRLGLKRCLIYFPLIIADSILGWYIPVLSFVCKVLYLLVLPILHFGIKNWKEIIRIILSNVLIFVFQLISLIFRNVGIGNFNDNIFLIQALIQIDYYLMILLFYLYYFRTFKINRKEKK